MINEDHLRETGVLLVNLGTPDELSVSSVRRYLAEFLDDPRVIDLAWPLRKLLLHGIILRTRPKKSLEAYRAIWTEDGSPLRVIHNRMKSALQNLLGPKYRVEMAMRYGSPSFSDALKALEGLEDLVVIPLYPQYASSSTGTALEALFRELSPRWNIPALRIMGSFSGDPDFIQASCDLVREHGFKSARHDFVLFSFHGLPERHIRKGDQSGHCLSFPDCCAKAPAIPFCYRAQCFQTAHLMAEKLGLSRDQYSVAFQSRLGRDPWIKPYTDHVFNELGDKVNSLAVVAPSFSVDCLETLEELGIRGKEQFLGAGGKSYVLYPCLNDYAPWMQAIARKVRQGF